MAEVKRDIIKWRRTQNRNYYQKKQQYHVSTFIHDRTFEYKRDATGPRRWLHLGDPLRGIEDVKAPNFPDSVTTGDVNNENDKTKVLLMSLMVKKEADHVKRVENDYWQRECLEIPRNEAVINIHRFIKKEGDPVAMDEIVLEIETDKTALPVMSPGHGKVVKFLVKDGEAVKSQQPLFQVDITGVAPAAAPAPAPAAAKAPAAAPAPAPAPAPAAARAPAAAAVKATVVKGAKVGPTAAALRIGDPSKSISGTRSELPVPMNKMRKRIAERLKEAQNTTAMLTTFNECDMSKLMAFRKANLKDFVKKYGVKLSFMSPFLKAAANALMDQPVVNGVIVGEDIVYRDYVDISVAVATPRGLVVPVLRSIESMDYPKIELAMAAMAEKARTGKLTPGDMQGGTFTISNGGVFGSLLSMPIINLPQSAILGMHAIVQRPVAVGTKIEIRPMMYLALSYDHRLIDGREAVVFLKKVKSGVEDPTSILAGM